ncbi:MAG: tetratricopeptide repeat protein [Candidatus Kuenenia sp.]|nr:tetratricopeptide repeat protein [Candidatus Kuenenia hertensis]
MIHDAFASSKTELFVGRQRCFNYLDEHVKGGSPPLVVFGEPGIGKSALLANWGKCYLSLNPGNKLIIHFIDISSCTKSLDVMLLRIMRELKHGFNLPLNIPANRNDLNTAFVNSLSMAAAKGKVVIILDSIDQLEERELTQTFSWLPFEMPANIRLILSVSPGAMFDAIAKRNWPLLEVKPFETGEQSQFIHKYLQYTHSKTFNEDHIETITNATQTSNPLYLHMLMDELCIVNNATSAVEHRLKEYLSAQTVEDLILRVIERCENDTELNTAAPELFRKVMSLLSTSGTGLLENELKELLQEQTHRQTNIQLQTLLSNMKHILIQHSSLFIFKHRGFQNAVIRRYLSTEAEKIKYHLYLANYFEKNRLGLRSIKELPWHLSQARSWNALFRLLSDLSFFNALHETSNYDAMYYWSQIEENSQMRISYAYCAIMESPGNYLDRIKNLSFFLKEKNLLTEALKMFEYLVFYYGQNNDYDNLPIALGMLADILYERGGMEESMQLHRDEEQIYRSTGNNYGLMQSLSHQAIILFADNDWENALQLYKKEEKLCRELKDDYRLLYNLNKQAKIAFLRQETDLSMELLMEAESISRNLGDMSGLSVCLGNKARISKTSGNLDEAITLLKEQENICRTLGNNKELSACLGNQSLILISRGDFDGALALLKEEENLCKKLHNEHALSYNLGNRANIFSIRGNLAEALELYKKQSALFRKTLNKHGLSYNLGNQANIHYTLGNSDEAMSLYTEQERLCRELGNEDGLSYALGNQANIFADRGDLDKALELHKEEERICRKLSNIEGLQRSLGNQASILYSKGNLHDAFTLHKEEERLCKKLGNKKELSACLGNQALVIKDLGNPEEAIVLLKEQETICRALGLKSGLAISLANQAEILAQNTKQTNEALPLAEEAYTITTSFGFHSLSQEIEPILHTIRSLLSK